MQRGPVASIAHDASAALYYKYSGCTVAPMVVLQKSCIWEILQESMAQEHCCIQHETHCTNLVEPESTAVSGDIVMDELIGGILCHVCH